MAEKLLQPDCWLVLYFTNNIFAMDDDDNLASICVTNELFNAVNNLLNNLLEDGITDRDIFNSCAAVSHKQQALENQEVEDNQRFDLKSIEKQEFNRTFPEKAFPELLEEDALQMNISFRKCLNDSLLLQKKSTQINKAAYLNESRQDKLTRYREKKARRVWHRKISYDCRKIVADNRVRKNGRFVKKEEDKYKESPRKHRQLKIQICVQQQDLSFKVQEYYD